MCTIGAVFKEKYVITFKQMDLAVPTVYFEPCVIRGNSDIQYLKFGREGNSGTWCGINNYGVSLITSDSYMSTNTNSINLSQSEIELIFGAYNNAIANYKDAYHAAEYMCEFYKSFLLPDITIISDAKESYYIETFNKEIICVKREFNSQTDDNYFVATNHFRFIHDAVEYKDNHSTFLRLERAERILQGEEKNVFKVLLDQYYGKSVLSICREKEIVPEGEGAFFTQASAVFSTNGNIVNCAYLINGNPISKKYTVIHDVFGRPVATISDEIDSLNEKIF